ncbi:hypothetical protein E2493_06060 [Sphingomonas parva]|uniref:Uncharacterized protein n=1 Tax=Sphingomonas parva TaxID=2555898 RepID=A0A4Y8ZSR4_9SPHN|nr:hypothetical protein [Sphingomonas parva]TFI59088.1 hypothetical protein E2493_06060 [Sphingomonas parva]
MPVRRTAVNRGALPVRGDAQAPGRVMTSPSGWADGAADSSNALLADILAGEALDQEAGRFVSVAAHLSKHPISPARSGQIVCYKTVIACATNTDACRA